MDWNSIIISICSSIVAATIAGVFSVLSVKKQLKQTQSMAEEQKDKEILHNRPELEIVSFSPITQQCGYFELDINTTPHIDAFIFYDSQQDENELKKIFDKNNWVHCEYVLRNIGVQSLYSVEVFSQSFSLKVIDLNERQTSIPIYEAMNPHARYQRRRIHNGDTLTLRLWYNKNHIFGDPLRNPITIILKDFDKNYWEQPINAPYDFLEESKQISTKERLKLLKSLFE